MEFQIIRTKPLCIDGCAPSILWINEPLTIVKKHLTMNKETFQQRKMQALIDNIEAHQRDLQTKETLFENPGLHFITKQEKYNTKDFKRAEELVQIIYKQGGMRSISSSHQALYTLHKMKKNVRL